MGKKAASVRQAQLNHRANQSNPNSRTYQAQQNSRSNQLNPNNPACAGRPRTNSPTASQAQLNQRANQLNPNSKAYAGSRTGAAANTGAWSSVSPGNFQSAAQGKKLAESTPNPAPHIEQAARRVFGSNTHLLQCGSRKKRTHSSASDLDYRLATPNEVTRKQRQALVEQLRAAPGNPQVRAKTNAIAIKFDSGCEVDVVPMEVAYSSKQQGFESRKKHHTYPEFAHSALQHAATMARAEFQANGGPVKGYEVDNAILQINAKQPNLKDDQTGKLLFDRLIASGPKAFQLHEDPKGKSIEKRTRALEQRVFEVKSRPAI